jgi:hypothetical protein
MSGAAFASVQLVDGLYAHASTCSDPLSCAPPAGTTTSTAPRVRRHPAVVSTPTTTAHKSVVAPSTTRAATPTSAAPADPPPPPTTCARVVAGIPWPAGWKVQCDGPRAGLLGATQPAGVTDLFVRRGETMGMLHVVALHEAGHAWDFAGLDPSRIAQWCAVRGCDAGHFFSGSTSSQGWAEASGAEDWAAVWDGCHGGEYHRSYLGLGAPAAAQCALQNRLVGYPA